MEFDTSTAKKCVICELIYEEDILVCVTSKGLQSLRHAAIKRQQPKILNNIIENCFVHEKCRKKYVSKDKVDLFVKNFGDHSDSSSNVSKQLNTRKQSPIKKDVCIFCFKNNK